MKSITHKRWHMIFVLFAVFSAVSGIVTRKAEAQVGPQAIKGCAKITQPGSYVVANNINATAANLIPTAWGIPGCLVIAADFVTLDLGGFTLFGPGSGVYAVGVITATNSYRGSTVRSGGITNFFIGLYLGSSIGLGAGYVVEHVRAIGNTQQGINVFSDGSRIVGNMATNNGSDGISLLCPAVVLENMAYRNGGGQIVESGSPCTNVANDPAP
jgi:hypothetical protein